MNKNLRTALIDSCIRLLNHLGSQIGNPEYADIYGFITDVAFMLDGLQKEANCFPMHPDVLVEALAYECKKPQPNPDVVSDLALMCQGYVKHDILPSKSH